MQKNVFCLALIYIISTFIVHGVDVNSLCGDDTWIPYKDEKCLKLFRIFETRYGAEDVCNGQNSTLVAIRSAAEQIFLTDYIYKSSVSNSVWIGALRRLDNDTEFEWNDGSTLRRFNNWAIERPSYDVRRTCVNMVPSILLGKLSEMEWFDTTCTSGNWFVCEKLQTWPFDHFHQAILAIRADMQHSIEDFTIAMTNAKNQIKDLQDSTIYAKNQIKELQDNPIPIGFIYVQLPNQLDPRNLWQSVQWVEISSEFAGLFFRVWGGGSANFGTIQAENSPRITRISTGGGLISNSADFPAANVSGPASYISTGNLITQERTRVFNFHQSGGEVRPRNHAVRIWRRAT